MCVFEVSLGSTYNIHVFEECLPKYYIYLEVLSLEIVR